MVDFRHIRGDLVAIEVVGALVVSEASDRPRTQNVERAVYLGPCLLGVRIAAGEWLSTRHEFVDLMDRGKIDVAQPDIGRVGGLTEARRVAQQAAERGLVVVPHAWKTGLSIAAAAHFAAATAQCAFIEFVPRALTESALRRELTVDELEMLDGRLSLPTRPGLGAEIDRAALQHFRVSAP